MADNIVGWVAGPTERGTLSIVWSCVTTMFACTWTVLHLNVPAIRDKASGKFWRQVKWMVINILFPEFILSKAICDLRLALQELSEFDVQLHEIERPIAWSSTYENGRVDWSWEIEYPPCAAWLYAQLRLERPPHLPEHEASTAISIRHHLGRFINGAFRRGQQSPKTSGDARGNNEARTAQGFVIKREPQKWTIVHSYYAQMGGLVYSTTKMRVGDGVHREVDYATLTATQLTSQYHWSWEDEASGDEHPLTHLVLDVMDIQDKSKADWFIKGVATIQVIWIIFNGIARHIIGLPVTQIEIATIAFAVIAVFTYVANAWKPKDLSRPTVLQFRGALSESRTRYARKQSFTRRFLFPSETVHESTGGYCLKRVPNDEAWLEEGTPALFTVMIFCSLLFGGLHCLAWNSAFPTRVELILWRVASLTSAFLPFWALVWIDLAGLANTGTFSLWLKYKGLTTDLSQERLGEIPTGAWDSLFNPQFMSWSRKERLALMRTPKRSRSWEDAPTPDITERFSSSGTWEERIEIEEFFSSYRRCQRDLQATWGAHLGRKQSNYLRRKDWKWTAAKAQDTMARLEGKAEILEFWQDYEEFVSNKLDDHDPKPQTLDGATYLQQMLKEILRLSSQAESLLKEFETVSRVYSISSIVIYITARVIILVLLFTCLRDVPADVYQNPTWTRFLPKIS